MLDIKSPGRSSVLKEKDPNLRLEFLGFPWKKDICSKPVKEALALSALPTAKLTVYSPFH